MTIEQALVAWINADSSIGVPVYSGAAPQGAAPPVLVYQRLGTAVIQTKDGPAYLTPASFQITAWGSENDPGSSKTLADAVRVSLINGLGSGATYDGVSIQQVLWTNEIEHYDPSTMRPGRVLTFRVWFTENY